VLNFVCSHIEISVCDARWRVGESERTAGDGGRLAMRGVGGAAGVRAGRQPDAAAAAAGRGARRLSHPQRRCVT
jgi:hypothetical protein